MLSRDKNELLCNVDPGTPMGTALRRSWVPVMASEDLPDHRPGPKKCSLLGEELVVFRRPDGVLGLVGAFCPHRCASLALARNEPEGLRCIYHGWCIAPDGQVVETPNEPPGSRLGERVEHLAYPVREAGGLIWAFLGEGEAPPLPHFEWMGLPSSNVAILQGNVGCNWLQVLEGTLDSSHVSILHRDIIRGGTAEQAVYSDEVDHILTAPAIHSAPTIDVRETPTGFEYAASRVHDQGTDRYVRVMPYVYPFYTFIPVGKPWGTMDAAVPLTNQVTAFYNIRYRMDAPVDVELLRRQTGRVVGVDVDGENRRLKGVDQLWGQDRYRMSTGESFSGLHGTYNEDAAVTESMGPVVDRTREHLGRSDRAIVHLRRHLEHAAREPGFADGLVREPVDDVHAFDRVLRADDPIWEPGTERTVSAAKSRIK